MSATPENWRVQVHKGDKLEITTTYDSKNETWYEAMGIMVVWMADGTAGADPFSTSVNAAGFLTHGHLPEDDNHGGPTPDTKHYFDETKLPSHMVPNGYVIDISNFAYASGDMSLVIGAHDQAGPVDHVRQSRRPARERHLAHDHGLP